MNRRFALKATVAAAMIAAVAGCAQDRGDDIIDIASSNPNFTTLTAAIGAAGLTETLQGPGPFTVFAPTDAAFAALPPGTVETLLLPENKDQLTAILTYHVLPSSVTSDQIIGRDISVQTVNGKNVRVNGVTGKFGSSVRVNNANVTSADIIASNGVIHVIDAVLLP